MPVRKIPKSYRNVTGMVADDRSGRMIGYESRLEHDCLKLVRLNDFVLRAEEQPVKVEFADEVGRPRHYHPDLLVEFRQDTSPARYMRPVLAEVKYRTDLFKQWAELKPRLRAGRRYAAERGWDFVLLTDREINTPYLKNAIFLLAALNRPPDSAQVDTILHALDRAGEIDPQTLLRDLGADGNGRAEMLPVLWRLIAERTVRVDLTRPLTMRSRIRVVSRAEKEQEDERLYQHIAGRNRLLRWQVLRHHGGLEP